jgi:GH25 family lysozyme M1 (1,4-beta-N-acetylmuramidase)
MFTGPDVSHHQKTVDWSAVARAGHAFAWCKATEDVTFVDDRFAENYTGIRSAGLVRGAYHFLRHESSAADQAQHFVDTVGQHGGLDGSMAAVDVETRTFVDEHGHQIKPPTNPTPAQVREFATEFRRLVPGHPLVIYTGHGWWTSHGENAHGADLGPLWHSRFRPLHKGPGPMYGGWDAPTFWQHTDQGTCSGIAGGCDLNQFNGDRSDLRRLTGAEEDDLTPEQARQLADAETRTAAILKLLRDDGDVGRRVRETILLTRAIADIDAGDEVTANAVQPGSKLRTALRRLVRLGADDASTSETTASEGALARRLDKIEADLAEIKARL